MSNVKQTETIHDIFPAESKSYKKIMADIEPYLSGSDTKLLPAPSHWEVVAPSNIQNFTKKEKK